MKNIIVTIVVLLVLSSQVVGQENDVNIKEALNGVGIPEAYKEVFLQRANSFLESVKSHNNEELSKLLGSYFDYEGKQIRYFPEEKLLAINKLNSIKLLNYKILTLGYSPRNFSLPFEKRKLVVFSTTSQLINGKLVEKELTFLAYRFDNHWYFTPHGVVLLKKYN